MMNRKRAFLPVLHSCFIFLILVLLFPNLAYSFPADFDGDGKNDFVVWRQPEAVWYVWPSRYSVSHSCPPHFQQIGGPGVYLGCKAQWGLPGDKVLSGNYDNDALADLVIWRPSTQTWWIKFSSYDGVVSVPMGLVGDVPDEFNVDILNSVSELMLYRPSTPSTDGRWFIRSSIPPYTIRNWTAMRRIVSPASLIEPSFTNSATFDYHPASGLPAGPAFFSNCTYRSTSCGYWFTLYFVSALVANYNEHAIYPEYPTLTSFIPVGGNYGGVIQNRADYALWDTSNGNWLIDISGDNGQPPFTTTQWGLPGDTPLVGDYDGDGIADLTVWRGASAGGWEGTWFLRPSSRYCPAYMTPLSGGGCYKQWGLYGDIPIS